MAKIAKKASKPMVNQHRTIEERLDTIENGIIAMLMIIATADISVKKVPTKTVKKAKK